MNKASSAKLAGLTAGVLAALTGCNKGDESAKGASLDGPAFDIKEVGLRGMDWEGEAKLLGEGLDFSDAEMTMNTVAFSLIGHDLDLSDYDDPPLEYDGEPVTLTLYVNGMVEDHEPGKVTTELDMRPEFSGGLGSKSTREMVDKLEQNGITIPDTEIVTFEVSASDEDYTEIMMSSEVDYIHSISMKDGETSPL